MTALIDVQQLVEAVRQGGKRGEEAVLALGLLIERQQVRRPVVSDDGGIEEVLGTEYADYSLSDEEMATAVEGLLRHLAEAGADVEVSTVWALGKSYEPIVVQRLVDLLINSIERPEKEDVAFQALLGVINSGIGSDVGEPATEAVRAAATRGSGRVAETAREYLDGVLYSRIKPRTQSP